MDRQSPADERLALVRDSFEDFYSRELQPQVRQATFLLGSVAEAEDVVHDCFVELHARWGSIADPGPYLQRSVLNRSRDRLRRRAMRRRVDEQFRPIDVPETEVPLFDALASLSFHQRAAVVLKFYCGLSHAEIADRLDCSTGSVGPWIKRGLEGLATQLQLPNEES
ncbi:MAG: sigma-70 family RNA polymerase sigma factor [Actinomycetota bacterium]